MTPIEAARELEDVGLVEFDEDDKRSSTDFIRCTVCQTVTKSDTNISHRDDCPVPMLPKIVAALEAAERVAEDGVLFGDVDEDQRTRYGCGGCGAEQEWSKDFPHAPDCPVRGLEMALKGEPA